MLAERITTATTKGSCTNERNASKLARSGGGGSGGAFVLDRHVYGGIAYASWTHAIQLGGSACR